jgi:hypothetical protein
VFLHHLEKELRNILFNIAYAVCILLCIILLYRQSLYATLLGLALSAAALLRWRSWVTAAVFCIGALVGVAVENIAIYFGAWHYSVVHAGYTPLWLFIAWGAAAAFIYQTALELRKLGMKQ